MVTQAEGKGNLQILLFGAPRCLLNGMPLRFARRKSLALLAYLAMTGRIHTREALATLLAGETSEQLARQHLRNTLHDLTSRLGPYAGATLALAGDQVDRPHAAKLAARLAGAADRLLLQSATKLSEPYAAMLATSVAHMRSILGDEAYEQAWAAGHATTADRLLQEALAALPDYP